MTRSSELGSSHAWGRVLLRSITAALPMVMVAVGVDRAVAATHDNPLFLAFPAQPGLIVPAQPGGTAPPVHFSVPSLRFAAPAQPGITPGPLPRHITPAVRPPDEPPAPTTDYGSSRRVPPPRYAAPLNLQQLHPPRPVPPVAPILPPPNMIRIGGFVTPAPEVLPVPVVNQLNTAAADAEARIDTFSRSIGIQPSRSDRIAAATIGGAALGIVGAGLTATVLAGAAGAGVGSLVGAGVGAAAVLVPTGGLATPILPQSVGVGALLGALIGGAAPAALIAIPAAVAGGVAGGLVGASVGSTTS